MLSALLWWMLEENEDKPEPTEGFEELGIDAEESDGC